MRVGSKCYFVKRSKREGDEIISISFDDFDYDVLPRCVYKIKEKILQIQVDYNEL